MKRRVAVWSSVFFVNSVVLAAVLPLPSQSPIYSLNNRAVSFQLAYQTGLRSGSVTRRGKLAGDGRAGVELASVFYPAISIEPWRVDANYADTIASSDLATGATYIGASAAPVGTAAWQATQRRPRLPRTPPQVTAISVDVAPRMAPQSTSTGVLSGGDQADTDLAIAGFSLMIAQQSTPTDAPQAAPPPPPPPPPAVEPRFAPSSPAAAPAAPPPPPPLGAPQAAPASPEVDAPAPTPPRTQDVPTKYVWRPREAISQLIPGFQLGRWEGRLEGYWDQSRIETENPTSETRNDNRLLDARLTLRNRGAYVIDPRLLRLTFGGTVGIIERELDVVSGEQTIQKDDKDGDVLGYEFLAELLPLNSFSVDLFANRNRVTESGTLVGPLLTDISNAGIRVAARRLYIPSTLTVRIDRAENESGTEELVTSRRDETRQSVIYDGRRGWLHRALRLRYRFLDRSDKFRSTTDFRTHEGRAFYTMDFGPELRKRLDSSVRVVDRRGLTDETRLDLDQSVQIDHTDRLRTRYRYLGAFTNRTMGDTDSNTLSFILNHKLYDSLDTTFELAGTNENFPGGSRERRRGRLEFDYEKNLPIARLYANLALFKDRQEDDFETTQGFVSQEPYRMDETFALPVSMVQPFVDPGSVVIFKTRNGPDISDCARFTVPQALVEGVDYELRTTGALTEIVPLPCSLINPGLNPGDLILADYTFTVDPSLGIESDGYVFDVSLDQGNVRPFYRREEIDQDLIAGFNTDILNDREKEIFGIELKYDTRILLANFRAQRELVISRDQDYEADTAIATLIFNLSRRWRIRLSGRISEREFTQPQDRLVDLWALRGLLTFTRDANFRIELFGEVREYEDTLVPDERHEEVGARALWRLGKLDVRPTIKYIQRRRGDTDLKDHRATLRVIRRF